MSSQAGRAAAVATGLRAVERGALSLVGGLGLGVGGGSPARRSVGQGARRAPSVTAAAGTRPSGPRVPSPPPSPGAGAGCRRDSSTRRCQGRLLLGSARGGACRRRGCCPPLACREGASLGEGECWEVEEPGPECPSPLWGIEAREGGPLEALVPR